MEWCKMITDNEKVINRFDGYYDFLSNFYPACISIDGEYYLSSEAAYQAFKCKNPTDREPFYEITADEAKRLGRKIEVRSDWDEVKLSVMEKIVRAKFTQNPYLARYLLETGEKEIVEGNHWNDVFWGVDLKTGEGENHLGKILMALRDKFRENGLPKANENMNPFRNKVTQDEISVQFCDITQIPCECLVNAAENTILNEKTISAEILRAAGNEFLEICAEIKGCQVSEAKISEGCRLAQKYVIHTMGAHYGQKGDTELLRLTYQNVLNLAKEYNIHSIAFPVISVGRFSFPKEMATAIAIESIRKWKRNNKEYDMKVSLAATDLKIFNFLCFWCDYLYDEKQLRELMKIEEKVDKS